jgi:hypothetical protein
MLTDRAPDPDIALQRFEIPEQVGALGVAEVSREGVPVVAVRVRASSLRGPTP